MIQRTRFVGASDYKRSGPAVHAPLRVDEYEELTHQGLRGATESLRLEAGEVVSVWDLPADEVRSFAEVLQDLPPIPSRLLVRSAEQFLLELNPDYIHANEAQDVWDEGWQDDLPGEEPW